MNRTVLLLATAMLTATLAAAPPVAPLKKPAAARVPFRFFGQDTHKWVPQMKNVPKAHDVEEIGRKLSSRVRNQDPFGMATFPRGDSVSPIIVEEPSRPTLKVTLNQALQSLKLNGVNLDSKEFLIGGRSVGEGDVVELGFQKEIFQALVVEVGAAEIHFRDLQRGETGVLPHTLIPNLQLEPLRQAAFPLEARMTPMEAMTSGKAKASSPKKPLASRGKSPAPN
ncbi:MAG: hypothetical protein EOP86_02270 [Verrucomicrobiaceae bacterium]|nr:MAG: hypothetical protein EOP86_02270 [Verrucomicrobiaceae bacterium]